MEGERFETWKEEGDFKGVKKIVPTYEKGNHKIVFENTEELEKRKKDLIEELANMDIKLNNAQDTVERGKISKKMLFVIANSASREFWESRKERVNI